MSPALSLLVAACGGLGSLLRYGVDVAVTRRRERPLPLGTFVVNVSGALLLGGLAGVAPSRSLSLVLGTGLLGGYTTFSTWMLETDRLRAGRRPGWAATNLVASAIAGLAAVALGRAVT